ncbi:MAG TPA: 50S ribosomal protein L21 [Syntrophales bacterium]|nr:50S ribosomal protein L21 [Syntrophales bacterium]
MYAVIKTGGKQHKVSPGDIVSVEKLKGSKGETVVFDEVLFVSGDGEVRIGTPFLKGAHVEGEIIDQVKAAKLNVFKMKRRKGFKKKTGHRQKLTRMKIKEISI